MPMLCTGKVYERHRRTDTQTEGWLAAGLALSRFPTFPSLTHWRHSERLKGALRGADSQLSGPGLAHRQWGGQKP